MISRLQFRPLYPQFPKCLIALLVTKISAKSFTMANSCKGFVHKPANILYTEQLRSVYFPIQPSAQSKIPNSNPFSHCTSAPLLKRITENTPNILFAALQNYTNPYRPAPRHTLVLLRTTRNINHPTPTHYNLLRTGTGKDGWYPRANSNTFPATLGTACGHPKQHFCHNSYRKLFPRVAHLCFFLQLSGLPKPESMLSSPAPQLSVLCNIYTTNGHKERITVVLGWWQKAEGEGMHSEDTMKHLEEAGGEVERPQKYANTVNVLPAHRSCTSACGGFLDMHMH